MSVVRAAARAGKPRNTPQPAASPLGTQRAAGRPPMYTVGDPTMIGTGAGTGGWAGPAARAPPQLAPFIMWAAGAPSITVGCGSGPTGAGTTAPAGVAMSWVTGSVYRQAGPRGIDVTSSSQRRRLGAADGAVGRVGVVGLESV